MRDAREGELTEPSAADKKELEMYEQLMALDTDEDLMLPHPSTTVNVTVEELTIYPSPDFTIPPRHNTALM